MFVQIFLDWKGESFDICHLDTNIKHHNAIMICIHCEMGSIQSECQFQQISAMWQAKKIDFKCKVNGFYMICYARFGNVTRMKQSNSINLSYFRTETFILYLRLIWPEFVMIFNAFCIYLRMTFMLLSLFINIQIHVTGSTGWILWCMKKDSSGAEVLYQMQCWHAILVDMQISALLGALQNDGREKSASPLALMHEMLLQRVDTHDGTISTIKMTE